jgi:hypothetical protein
MHLCTGFWGFLSLPFFAIASTVRVRILRVPECQEPEGKRVDMRPRLGLKAPVGPGPSCPVVHGTVALLSRTCGPSCLRSASARATRRFSSSSPGRTRSTASDQHKLDTSWGNGFLIYSGGRGWESGRSCTPPPRLCFRTPVHTPYHAVLHLEREREHRPPGHYICICPPGEARGTRRDTARYDPPRSSSVPYDTFRCSTSQIHRAVQCTVPAASCRPPSRAAGPAPGTASALWAGGAAPPVPTAG